MKAGQTTTVELGYTGKEQPTAARVQDLTLPEGVTATAFIPPARRTAPLAGAGFQARGPARLRFTTLDPAR